MLLHRCVAATAIACSLAVASACTAGSSVTEIASLPPPDEFARVSGEVTRVAPFLDGGAYQLRDDSGTVWVVTATDLPAAGTRVTVEGTVVRARLARGDRDWGEIYLRERSRSDSARVSSRTPAGDRFAASGRWMRPRR